MLCYYVRCGIFVVAEQRRRAVPTSPLSWLTTACLIRHSPAGTSAFSTTPCPRRRRTFLASWRSSARTTTSCPERSSATEWGWCSVQQRRPAARWRGFASMCITTTRRRRGRHLQADVSAAATRDGALGTPPRCSRARCGRSRVSSNQQVQRNSGCFLLPMLVLAFSQSHAVKRSSAAG